MSKIQIWEENAHFGFDRPFLLKKKKLIRVLLKNDNRKIYFSALIFKLGSDLYSQNSSKQIFLIYRILLNKFVFHRISDPEYF